MIMALYKVKSDAIPQAYAVEITKAIPIYKMIGQQKN